MKIVEFFTYTIVFLLPAYLVRFELLGMPTNVLEVMVGMVFAVWITAKIKECLAIPKEWRISALPITNYSLPVTGIVLLFAGLIFGTIASPDMRTSLGVLKGWFLVPLAFFIVARSALDTKEKKEKALWSLALSGIAVAITGFFYWIEGSVAFDGRLSAFYESPNMLAMYIAPSLLIVMMALKEKPKIKNQKFLIFGAVFLIFILLLTRSAGAFIGVGGAAAFYFSTLRWGKVWGKLGISIVALIIIAGILLPASSLFLDPWDMGRTSIASRLMIWRASIEMIKDHWFFGIGPGTFQETYLLYQKNFPPYLEWAVPHPHNIFLTTWLYGGLLGLIGFLLLLFWFFVREDPKPYPLNPIPFLIIFYLLAHGSIDNTLWRGDVAMVFWLLILTGSSNHTCHQ